MVRSAVVRFTACSVLALLVLISATLLVAERIARDRALEDARYQGAGMAQRLVAPLVDAGVRERSPGAAAALDTVMVDRMRDGSLTHVRVWDEEGRILWADEADLIGRRFELESEVVALFGTHGVIAELSDLERAENATEQAEDELLEVYAGALDADGVPMVFEAYLPVDEMEKDARAIMVSFVSLSVGALVLFLLIVLPLAVSLGRRVQRAQVERSRMVRHALRASDLERRRIAQELHDGVVQDLAGLGYALPAAAREVRSNGDLGAARSAVEGAVDLLRHDVALLRSVMTDLYPPDVHGLDLGDAVRQVVHHETGTTELATRVRVEPGLRLADDDSQLAFRVVREGLRNVVRHARASQVEVSLARRDDRVLVVVRDDGLGPGPDPGDSPRGHLGLRLLRDTVLDLGGDLAVSPSPEGGTSLEVTFPFTPPPG